MSKVLFDRKPQGFRLMPDGEQNLLIQKVEGLPRDDVKLVKVKFVNEEGITLENKYDLTSDGGYAAFYYLVTNGVGVELDGEFDIDNLEGKYVLVEIVHKEGTKQREDGTFPVFANIRATIGPGTPFGDDESGEWN